MKRKQKDKSETALKFMKEFAKNISWVGTTMFRTLRDGLWFSVAALILNSYSKLPLSIEPGFAIFLFVAVLLFHGFTVKSFLKCT